LGSFLYLSPHALSKALYGGYPRFTLASFCILAR
jgi:hypothetical protein